MCFPNDLQYLQKEVAVLLVHKCFLCCATLFLQFAKQISDFVNKLKIK